MTQTHTNGRMRVLAAIAAGGAPTRTGKVKAVFEEER
jgi:hypothetical protein